MRTILIVLFIFYCKNINAEQSFKIIASVNNNIITNIDLEKEIKIINILYKQSFLGNDKYKIALDNLINDTIKLEEINKTNLLVDEKIINENFQKILIELNKDKVDISKHLQKKIYEKIKVDYMWNFYISKKYSSKISINMNEIDDKLNNIINKSNPEDKINSKERLILIEKNKKLQIFSNYNLENLKKNSLIKYYK